ncbi:MAG: hypothetical protein AAFO77_02315 [Pseudomonadota bacterium]
MMTKTKTLLAITATTLMMSTSSFARDALIGLSSAQSPKDVKAQTERVIQFLVETLDPGEKALLFDATNVRLIGTFAVPNKSSYANARAKLQANDAVLKQLKTFIEASKAVPGKVGRLNLPGLLRTVREDYPSDKDRSFVVLGSPHYDDPLTPSLSMQNGHVPNDGHVGTSIAHSPYGTRGLKGSLKGVDLHFGLVGHDKTWAISKRHAYTVERFWTLTAEGHGASMSYFGDDLETLFEVAAQDTPARRHAATRGPTDKLFMIYFKKDGGRTNSLNDEEPQKKPAPTPIWKSANKVRIGLKWDCDRCDLDLHVRPRPTSKVISFADVETREGKFFKDFTRSPSTNGFETIQLKGTFDLSKTLIAVNFYGGRASKGRVNGQVRIAIGDKVWATPISIKASKGNKGRGVKEVRNDGVATNTHWVIIDPVEVVTKGARSLTD